MLMVLMFSGYSLCENNVKITTDAAIQEKWVEFNLTSGDAMVIKILNISTANVTFVKGPGIIVSPVGGEYPALAPIVTLYFDLNGSAYAFFPSKTLSLGHWEKGENITLMLTDRTIILKNGNIVKSFKAPTKIEPTHYITVGTTSRMMNATLEIEKINLFKENQKEIHKTLPSMSLVYFLAVLGVGGISMVLYNKKR